MKTLLIIWHSRTGAAEQLAQACARAAQDEIFAGAEQTAPVQVTLMACSHVTAENLLNASAYVFVCPENLGSMSGAMKEFFDSNYYAVLDHLNGRPYQAIITAGSDGQGALRQLQRICTGWRLKPIAEHIVVNLGAQTPEQIWAKKLVASNDIARAELCGASFAAGLALGVF